MTYLSDKNKSKKRVARLVGTVAILAVISFGWVEIRETLFPVAEPVFVSSHSVLKTVLDAPFNLIGYFRSQAGYRNHILSLENRTEELENEIASLKAEKVALGEVDATLKSDGIKENSKSTITFYPLAEDITKLYSTLVLSKGFKDGIKEDTMIYLRGRQPACVIEKVHAATSICKLLSAAGNNVEGVTFSTKENINLVGLGGGSFLASVPKGSNFVIGEDIMYRADQSLKLGQIVDIKDDPQDVSVKVYVLGAYNPVTSSLFYADKE